MKYATQRVVNRLGYRLTRLYDRSLEPELVEAIRAASAHTTTGNDAIIARHDAVRYVVRADIPGSFVECGVWKGGSLLVIARALMGLGVTDRELIGFDTFAGMPAPTEEDVRYDGRRGPDAPATNLHVAPSIDDLRSLVVESGYPPERASARCRSRRGDAPGRCARADRIAPPRHRLEPVNAARARASVPAPVIGRHPHRR